MSGTEGSEALEGQIDQWRTYLRHRQAIHSVDVAELEDHLREQIAGLTDAGLAADEAFLVAVKRMGDLDTLSREFAREHSDRLWKQLVVPSSISSTGQAASGRDAGIAFSLAFLAALLVKLPELFGISMETHERFYIHNLPILVLATVAGYFAWKRQLAGRTIGWLALGFGVTAIFSNGYPFAPEGSTEILTILHVPIGLWLGIGVAYAGSRWREIAGRMDFIRFTGEIFIYYVLIALGGGVFTGFLVMIFEAIGVDMEPFLGTWLIPCGAAGAVVVAAWLVEAKQSVIENMAPVLTRLFTPFFTVLLLTFLGVVAWTGAGMNIDRDMLIGFDALLIMVLALLVYSVSARDPKAAPGPFDVLQVVLVISALVANGVALWAIAARISEWGVTPNRVAALGVNVMLLVNLAWSAVLYLRFIRARGPFTALERWQTAYLPVYAVWVAIVVIVFPPLFGYI